MKLLIVAMSESIHTARWISQLDGLGWEVYLFPSIETEVINPELRNVALYRQFFKNSSGVDESIQLDGTQLFSRWLLNRVRSFLKIFSPDYREKSLARVIRKVKPDIIHTMEAQSAGYLTCRVRRSFSGSFPLWIHTNWGIDLHYYERFESHKKMIKELMSYVDIFLPEGKRDAKLAKKYGFTGKVFQIPTVAGGFDIKSLPATCVPSQRKTVIVKGYQNEIRKALVAMEAIERSADILIDYEILVYSASPDVAIRANEISESTGLKFKVLPVISHDEMLKVVSEARISITVNLSDGVPNSMLEAMMLGAFPIQSNTSCADEWITDGKTGLLVSPEDAGEVASAIRRAISDDDLVDTAAVENYRRVSEKLDGNVLRSMVKDIYETSVRRND